MDTQETVSLKEFFEVKFKAIECQTKLRFDSLDKALILAHEDAKVKYEHLDKLRDEVTTDRGMLVVKESCLTLHKDISKWMEAVNKKITVLETRSITWTAAVGVFFLILTFVMRWYGK